ncbi:unnamed protein product, partial [Ascophyllum nodosum]
VSLQSPCPSRTTRVPPLACRRRRVDSPSRRERCSRFSLGDEMLGGCDGG